MDDMKILRIWITTEMDRLGKGIVYDAARRTFQLVLDLMDVIEESHEQPQEKEKEENLPGQMEMKEYLGE